jgi:hypothetical protein
MLHHGRVTVEVLFGNTGIHARYLRTCRGTDRGEGEQPRYCDGEAMQGVLRFKSVSVLVLI